jgi:hypothetical protein
MSQILINLAEVLATLVTVGLCWLAVTGGNKGAFFAPDFWEKLDFSLSLEIEGDSSPSWGDLEAEFASSDDGVKIPVVVKSPLPLPPPPQRPRRDAGIFAPVPSPSLSGGNSAIALIRALRGSPLKTPSPFKEGENYFLPLEAVEGFTNYKPPLDWGGLKRRMK